MGRKITRLCAGDAVDSCRKREIESVGTVELVCGSRLLRMGGEVGSLAKGSWLFGWLGQLPDSQEISVGWEQDGLRLGAILPRVSAQST